MRPRGNQQNLCVCVHHFTMRACGLQVMQFDVSNDTVRKQITAELRTLYDSHHAFIVRYYQVNWM
jgi:serine/threonine protein kinase